jgi:hypothetical protein
MCHAGCRETRIRETDCRFRVRVRIRVWGLGWVRVIKDRLIYNTWAM